MPKQKLTQQFVDRCKPKKSKVDYFDTDTPGLLLRVMPSGRRTFSCRYRDRRGKQMERKLAGAHVLKLHQARQRVMAIQAQLASGEDPFEAQDMLKAVPTLASFVESAYLPHIKSYKRSWKTDECVLRNHILPALGALHMDDIRRQHLIELIAKHSETRQPATTNRLLILCRYLFNCALRWEVTGLTRNPTEGIALLPTNNQRDRYLSKDEALRLFEALAASSNPQLPSIVAMLLLTGARRSEVLKARWSDIDVERRSWRIKENKGGTTRYVPLSAGMMALLKTIPRSEDSDYIFTNPKTGKPFVYLFRTWHRARCQAGVPDVRMHDLRHTFASYVINAGHSLYEVQKLLGHTQITTTQRYAHLSQASLLSAADKAASAVPWERSLAPPAAEQPVQEKAAIGVEDDETDTAQAGKPAALPAPDASHAEHTASPSSGTPTQRRRVLRPTTSNVTNKETPGKTVSPPHSGEPPDREPST